MYIWVILLFITAGIVFGLDYLFRRKKWKDNSKAEKISLIVNMLSVAPYIFLSLLGMFWGIVPGTPQTAFGSVLYEATLWLSGIYPIIAVIAVILSFVLRKINKARASIWANVIAFLYIAVMLAVNSLAGAIL